MPVTDFILVVYLLVPPACYFNKTRTPCRIIYKVYGVITSLDNYFVEHIFQWLLPVSKKNKFAKVGQSVYLVAPNHLLFGRQSEYIYIIIIIIIIIFIIIIIYFIIYILYIYIYINIYHYYYKKEK